MKLRILSDLHLEVMDFSAPTLDSDKDTVLVLAGDIAPLARRSLLSPFLETMAAQFREVIYVMGNHEFFHGAWPGDIELLQKWRLPKNIHTLERSRIVIDGITFLGATLWSDLNSGDPFFMQQVAQAMPDYHHVRLSDATPGRPHPLLQPAHTLADHQKSLAWFDRELSFLRRENKPAVMISHHAPTPQSISSQYSMNYLNGAFVSDLTSLLDRTQPLLAIHGHTHNSCDYRIGQTQVVCNPRGYCLPEKSPENPAFNPFFSVELNA